MWTWLGLGLDEQIFNWDVQSRLEAVYWYFFKYLRKAAEESSAKKTLKGNEEYRRICQNLKNFVVLVGNKYIFAYEICLEHLPF